MATNTHSLDIESSSSQYASITDASQTGLDLADDFTIEFWVKWESLPTSGTIRHVVGKYLATAGNRSYSVVMFNDSGTMKLGLYTSADGNSAALITSNWAASTGVWYHVAIAYDMSAGQAFMYINGSSIGTPTGGATSLRNGAARFVIGARDGGEYSDGLFDDVRVWTTIRSTSDIADNRSKEIDPTTPNLVGYWTLNNNYEDQTANNNDLTASGGPVFSTDVPFLLGFAVEAGQLVWFV